MYRALRDGLRQKSLSAIHSLTAMGFSARANPSNVGSYPMSGMVLDEVPGACGNPLRTVFLTLWDDGFAESASVAF